MTTNLSVDHLLSISQKSFGLLQFSPQFPLGLGITSFITIAEFFKASVGLSFGLEENRKAYEGHVIGFKITFNGKITLKS